MRSFSINASVDKGYLVKFDWVAYETYTNADGKMRAKIDEQGENVISYSMSDRAKELHNGELVVKSIETDDNGITTINVITLLNKQGE